jgi:C-terminal processing protease CtpA/Prc
VFIDSIAPDSPAEKALSIKDEILNIGAIDFTNSSSVVIDINRFGRKLSLEVHPNQGNYFATYQVELIPEKAEVLKKWLG